MESTTCWTLECKIGLLSSRAKVSPNCLSIVILTIAMLTMAFLIPIKVNKIFSDANSSTSTLPKSFNENVSEILEFSFQLTPVFLF